MFFNGRTSKYIVSLITPVVFLANCTPAPPTRDNPWDKGSDNFTPPDVTITEVVVDIRKVTIRWSGNYLADYYQFNLDTELSDTTGYSSIVYEDNSEGKHIFSIKALNFDPLYNDSLIVRNTTFSINTLIPPYITFSPIKISSNSNISITCNVSQENLLGMHIEIYSECATLGDLIKNPELPEAIEILPPPFKDDKHRLVIDIAYLGKDNKGISGTVLIGSFPVTPEKSGTINIDGDSTFFRDIQNRNIIINSLDWVKVNK